MSETWGSKILTCKSELLWLVDIMPKGGAELVDVYHTGSLSVYISIDMSDDLLPLKPWIGEGN